MIEWFERAIFLLSGIGTILLSFSLIYFLYAISYPEHFLRRKHQPEYDCAIVEYEGDYEEWKNAIRSARSL